MAQLVAYQLFRNFYWKSRGEQKGTPSCIAHRSAGIACNNPSTKVNALAYGAPAALPSSQAPAPNSSRFEAAARPAKRSEPAQGAAHALF
jgi:hypothetical protein